MNRRLAVAIAALGVAVAAVVPYLSGLDGYFLSDDFGLVQLFAKQPTFHVLSLFTRAWTEGIYGITPDELRPTLALSYQVDSLWGAANPLGYHLTNLALHLLSSLLVFAIARSVADLPLPAATFAGAMFAVLPVHPETVAWISGRADSIPTLFYLAAFLGFALWRRSGRRLAYAAALAALLLGLFSKQSAITLPVLLVLYDLLVERRPIGHAWAGLRPYVPFAALTFGYLGLRYALFGNAVREQSITVPVLVEFAQRQPGYFKMLALGSTLVGDERISPELGLVGQVAAWALIGLALAFVLVELGRALRGRPGGLRGRLLFFGPVWWFTCIVPLVVTYVSPRHLYQAAAGPMVAGGLLFAALWIGNRPRRFAAALAALVLVLATERVLERPLREWNRTAVVSASIQADLNRELAAAPPGSLVLVAAPVLGPSEEYHVWLWMWSLPFTTRPPFSPPGLADRVSLVAPPDAYCCPRDQWLAATRASVASWAARPDHPPVIVLQWNPLGGLIRATDREQPDLHEKVLALGAAPTPRALCERLDVILGYLTEICPLI